ncbi:AAA family ATPase [Azotobacter beijerinckii]|uniref:AAA family ATPase n=1 Tax=Azotobacter beijerinckii TaxID=170623 RepID=UPI002954DD21|nr:AAA family ATPase [Azotobacter beijerinckii]MDV7210798.1 AAA family ATPase [Azotobacter beijerinckii]
MTSLHADEALLTYYQFSHDPFAPRTPGFKFFPAQRKQVLGQLHHLARYSRLLLVVSGPLGSGKTLLRQALVASSNKQAVLCVVVSARASARVDGLLRQIALGLGLEYADERSILSRVEQLVAAGQEVYLLVDDAELLETTALDALLALAAGTVVVRPRVFLFGEPELVTRLQSLAGGEERFHVLRLNPYALDDTREYLAQRLEGAGSDIGLFSDEQVEAIHRDSGGWPGEINRFARELLHEEMQFGHEEGGEDTPGWALPKKHLLALAAVVLAVVAAWFIRGGSEGEPPAVALQPPSEGSSAPVAEPASESRPVLREPLAQAASEADVEDIGVAGSAAVLAATSAAALAPANSPAPVKLAAHAPRVDSRAPAAVQPPPPPPQSRSVTLPPPVAARSVEIPGPAPAPRVAAKPVPAPAIAAPATQTVAKLAPAASVSQAAPKPAPQPASVPQAAPKPAPQPALSPQAAPKPAPQPAPAPQAAPKPAPQPAPVPQAAPKPAPQSAPVPQSAASRYTLQVLGTRSESSAQSFVRAQGAGYRYFRKLHQGQPLFVVTYGSFASRDEAQAAIQSLPASVQASKPWPRTLASIQQEAGSR